MLRVALMTGLALLALGVYCLLVAAVASRVLRSRWWKVGVDERRRMGKHRRP